MLRIESRRGVGILAAAPDPQHRLAQPAQPRAAPAHGLGARRSGRVALVGGVLDCQENHSSDVAVQLEPVEPFLEVLQLLSLFRSHRRTQVRQ